ncbi:MAG: tetratricopeptide repeat protein [Nitrosomonadales bacterium]|nr:MAG: tetratricopeptide repeat protein [Nitrosomonadales bacterium]
MQKPKRIMTDPDTGKEVKMPKITKGLIRANINNGPALYNLGTYEVQQGNFLDGEKVLSKAWEVEKNPETLLNLSTCYKFNGSSAKAAKALAECIRRWPNFALAYNNLGLINYDNNQFDAAVNNYRTAIKITPDYADAHWNLGLALGLDYFSPSQLFNASIQDFMTEYSWRFKKTNPVALAGTLGTPEWDGSPLGDRKLIILCEQGFGDMIQFMRYAYQFPVANVILHVPEALVPVVKSEYTITHVSTFPHDVWIAMCNLLKYVPVGPGVPYIRIPQYEKLLSNSKPNIGIVWKGSAKHANDKQRSLHYRDFLWLLKYGNVYSLQKDEVTKNAKDILPTKLGTWFDTARYINSMDLVVSVDTSVAHLVGAMGKPVITLIPSNGIDWRWGRYGESTVWYDSMRLCRSRDMVRCEEMVNDFLNNGNKFSN